MAPLDRAYAALRERRYDDAITAFLEASQAAPKRAAIRKDLAYTYLKAGETILARDQFAEAVKLDPDDIHVALEYGFLCATRPVSPSKARRIFDRLRQAGNPPPRRPSKISTGPCGRGSSGGRARSHGRPGISPTTRNSPAWPSSATNSPSPPSTTRRPASSAPTFATCCSTWAASAPRRVVPPMPCRACWRPRAAATPRTAERARALLPARYPYVYEFRQAIALDPDNVELRRELAYLLLEMGSKADAEAEFDGHRAAGSGRSAFDRAARASSSFPAAITRARRRCSIACSQSGDEELADRVRRALKLPQTLRKRVETPRTQVSIEARALAEKSLEKGYLKDALKYLQIAHENDPVDFGVMLKLGWTNNMLHDDKDGRALVRARPAQPRSGDRRRGRAGLPEPGSVDGPHPDDILDLPVLLLALAGLFTYGQLKTEFRTRQAALPPLRLRPLRRRPAPAAQSSARPAVPLRVVIHPRRRRRHTGVEGRRWPGAKRGPRSATSSATTSAAWCPTTGAALPTDAAVGRGIGSESAGAFFELNLDGIYVSRFNNDLLGLHADAHRLDTPARSGADANLRERECDGRRQAASLGQLRRVGPGVRLRAESMPPGLYFTVNYLRGRYTLREGNPYAPFYNDFRAGLWYAFTR